MDENLNNSVEFLCDVCNKSFRSPKVLRTHQQIHAPQQLINPPLPPVEPPPLPPLPIIPQIEGTLPNVYQDEAEAVVDQIYHDHGRAIDSYYRSRKLLDILNIRIRDNIDEVRNPALEEYNRHITSRIKANASPAYILQHRTTGELRYFHSSINNNALFVRPHSIGSMQEFEHFINSVIDMDLLAWIQLQRPNTAWKIHKLTNVTFYFYKLLEVGRIGAAVTLPDFIKSKKCIVGLDYDKRHKKLYQDNLCFFRALSIVLSCTCNKKCRCNSPNLFKTRQLFQLWKEKTLFTGTPNSFQGIKLEDLILLESLFGVSIRVFSLQNNGLGSCIWSSKSQHKTKLLLNLYENHFSLIKDLSTYTKSWICQHCKNNFAKSSNLKRHNCNKLNNRFRYPTGCYRSKPTIFDELYERTRISVPQNKRIYPYRITYDIEVFLEKSSLPIPSDKLTYTHIHRLMSISICSNVPQFESPLCLVSTGSECELVDRFVGYINKIQEESYSLLLHSFRDELIQLDRSIASQEAKEKDFEDAEFSTEQMYRCRGLNKLKERFINYLSIIPVIGFNSGSYDLNVMKSLLLHHFHENGKISFVIKRQQRLQCVQTNRFRFLDMLNYLTPETTYEKYLQAFGVSSTKGFFPYEYVTSLDKLNETELPSHKDFFSSLKNSNISEEEYKLCQDVWTQRKMQTLKDFLKWYNNLDVEPFLDAISKQSLIYSSKNIDMFKDAVSIPGVAVQWKFYELRNTTIDIPFITSSNKDLFDTIRKNIVGGPSIIFHRYHEKGVTKIRSEKYKDLAKTCQEILGCDANALYLWAMMQEMPTGTPIRRRSENSFRPEFTDSYGRMAWGWLEYLASTSDLSIQHKYNQGEYRVGQHGLPVDGYCHDNNTVYQFHGCLFHGHRCHLTKNRTHNPINNKSLEDLQQDTEAKESYVKHLGYKLVVMRECEWLDYLKSHQEANNFVKKLLKRDMDKHHSMTEDQIISSLLKDHFFGFIECDIQVPDNLQDKFSEMSPIFKNVKVGRDELSPHMREFAEQHKVLLQPQRMLIGSLVGTKILLLTPLAKWYVSHGLQITKVYQIIQYVPAKCFEGFGLSVTQARRAGDVDESKSLLASISKLVGNSVYGKMITNKEKHKTISYFSNTHEASKFVSTHNFVSLDELNEGFYEGVAEKHQILLDIPVALGHAVLQWAKQRMLEFYFDCIDKYIDRPDFQYCEMDTDSAYMALSGPLDDIIKPSLRREFYTNYSAWFPRKACENHHQDFIRAMTANLRWEMQECCQKIHKYDQRTPGLFKEEYKGTGIISLNSKTYYCWCDGQESSTKCRSKGLNKKQNTLEKDQFLSVLKNKEPVSGENRGFMKKNNTMYTYSQVRNGLTYFYGKRLVHPDGITTSPLKI